MGCDVMQRFNADNDRKQGARSRMVKKSFICPSIIIQKGNKCYKKKVAGMPSTCKSSLSRGEMSR